MLLADQATGATHEDHPVTLDHGRILTTHTGSLPRPQELIDAMWAREDGTLDDDAALAELIGQAVDQCVSRQVEAGIDVVNDGEMSKPSYATYVKDRLGGFTGESVQDYFFLDLVDYPKSAAMVADNPGRRKRTAPACTSEITVQDPEAAVTDMVNLSRSVETHQPRAGMFSSAASPGVVSLFFGNQHYATDREYVMAIAEAMRHEYEAIVDAGAFVQVDCPDLAMGRHTAYAELDRDAFRDRIALNIEAINHALRNIPADRARMHLCWGNYPGPHHHDVPITGLLDLVWDAKPQTVLIEAANPRHAHEWQVFESVTIPDGKVLCPGMIEPQSNYIEHPELVAQRIERYANLLGPDRVMAGVDCGFSVHVGIQGIDPDVAWAKLAALGEGAALASSRLF